tara:strand:+ start:724 stop:1239 length:516 start_codon:yes stop_codon:yes gene_type:complete
MLAKTYFKRSLCLCAVAVLLISGCAATGPAYTELKSTIPSLEAGKARLYFLRESAFMGSAIAARIQVNGIKVVDLYNDGFIYMDRPSGNVFIMVDAFMNPIGEWRGTFSLESGKEYYFFVTPNSNKAWAVALLGMAGALVTEGGPFKVYLIPKEMALEQLKTKKLSGSSSH